MGEEMIETIDYVPVEFIRQVIEEIAAEVNYDAAGHRYFWMGAEIPSASRILRPISDIVLANIPPDRLEAARKRGIDVHAAIDDYLRDGWDFSEGETAGYVEQFKRFMAEHKVQVICHETIALNKLYGYACRPDMVCYMDGERYAQCVDYKTTYEISVEVAIQLWLQEACISSYRMPVIEGKVLHLEPDNYTLKAASEIMEGLGLKEIEAEAKALITQCAFKTKFLKKAS